jgi:hypothetical protein
LDENYDLPADIIYLPKIGTNENIQWVHHKSENILIFCNPIWVERTTENLSLEIDGTFMTSSSG